MMVSISIDAFGCKKVACEFKIPKNKFQIPISNQNKFIFDIVIDIDFDIVLFLSFNNIVNH